MTKAEKKRAREEYKRLQYEKEILASKKNMNYPENRSEILDRVREFEETYKVKVCFSRDIFDRTLEASIEGVYENQIMWVLVAIPFDEQDIFPYLNAGMEELESMYGR